MTVVTSRADFERLMALRMTEAKLLLDQKDWDGAYYLAGYAVEFALKVRIITQLMKSDSFPDKKLSESFYKHDLTVLRKAADLEDEKGRCCQFRLGHREPLERADPLRDRQGGEGSHRPLRGH